MEGEPGSRPAHERAPVFDELVLSQPITLPTRAPPITEDNYIVTLKQDTLS